MCFLAATSGDICGKFKLANIYNNSTAETNQNTHTFKLKQKDAVESQTPPFKRISLQNPEPLLNSFEKMKLGANQYCASITPRTVKTRPWKPMTLSEPTYNGDDKFPLSQYELHCLDKFMRDEGRTTSICHCPLF